MDRRVVLPGDFLGLKGNSCPNERKTVRVQILGVRKVGRRGASRNTAIAHEASEHDGETRRLESLQERMEAWKWSDVPRRSSGCVCDATTMPWVEAWDRSGGCVG